MTASLSSHVLDVERGAPAAGVPITLRRGDAVLASVYTDADGRVVDLAKRPLEPGIYRLEFDVATYLKAHGRDAPFLRRVSIDFQIEPHTPHYHVPLLLSAYACTSYRGS